jgi:hypothetical protein
MLAEDGRPTTKCHSSVLLECYGSADVICQMAEVNEIDKALCSQQIGCDLCVATPLTNEGHLNTCLWFAGLQSCAHECVPGGVGCGVAARSCDQQPAATTSESAVGPFAVGSADRFVLFIMTSSVIATLSVVLAF